MLEQIRQENTHSYRVPVYNVGKDGLILQGLEDIKLTRGNKENPEESQTGFLTQDLIKLCIMYYEDVNVGDMRTRETNLAITKLEEALLWLNKRTQDRQERGVLNTYKK